MLLNDETYDLSATMAYLHSGVVEWYLRGVCASRKGGYMLVEQQSLEGLPIPKFLADKDSFARSELSRIAQQIMAIASQRGKDFKPEETRSIYILEGQINSIVMSALGLTMHEASVITARLQSQR